MCRGQDYCTELALDTLDWSKKSPLQPPEWFDHEIDLFEYSVEIFIRGDRDASLSCIAKIRTEEMTDWFIEHGQMSGRHRARKLNIPAPDEIPKELRDPVRSPKKLQEQVFKRDGYRCRYCGQRLISQKFMRAFIKELNSPTFQRGATNLGTHGIIHATWPVADHIKPWNYGGSTSMENLVSSCAACNYGKDGYTCTQLGIADPRLFEPEADEWDGLDSKL
jgi:5-methylcytosine-specific restriction endonuclease McrA